MWRKCTLYQTHTMHLHAHAYMHGAHTERKRRGSETRMSFWKNLNLRSVSQHHRYLRLVMYVLTYTYQHTLTHSHTHACTHAHTHILTQTHMHAHSHAHTHSHTCCTQIAEVEGHTQEVIAERTGVMVELERERAEQKARSLDLERLGKDLATAKEREATLLEDRWGGGGGGGGVGRRVEQGR